MTVTRNATRIAPREVAGGVPMFRRAFRVGLALALLICAVLYVLWTWHWPLVGDSTLIHYIVFLMDHGMAPYRDVPDMNLPGSFLVEWLAMHTYGGGALAWRLFDLTVLLAMGAGLVVLSLPYDWFAGVFSAVLIMLIHGRDGIYDTGQRDLTMAALVVVGYVFLFRARRKNKAWAAAVFGFCMAAAGTMKPTSLPLMVVLLALLLVAIRKEGRPAGRMLGWGMAGMALPLAIVWIFLVREDAVTAFIHNLRTVDPYFASLGRRPLSYLLIHSISPVMALVAVWLVLVAASAVASRPWREWTRPWPVEKWERAALVLGVLAGLAGYIAQGKAYPYQRYCFLVLLLLIIALDLTAALRRSGFRLALAVLGIGYGCLVLAPQSLAKVKQYDWRNQDYTTMMDADLLELGGSKLSGHIQCMDTTTGCSHGFYNLKLMPETGLLSDFLVFGPAQDAEIREERSAFLPQIEANPPWVMVVATGLFPKGPKDYQKLALWPAFDYFLNQHYRLCMQRTPAKMVDWGGGPPQSPPSYRIYVLDGPAQETARCEKLWAGGE